MMALRTSGSDVWSTDVAVPISRLPEIIGRSKHMKSLINSRIKLTVTEISKKEIVDLDLFAGILGHIGDGNFHASIMFDRQDKEETERVEKVVYNMVDRALEMEGSCTV